MTLASVTNRLVGYLGTLGAGELADLRRLDPDRPSAPAYWRIAGQEHISEHDETSWALAISLLAQLHEQHTPKKQLGAALAESGVNPARVTQLLRAHDGNLEDVLRRIVHQLHQKRQPTDLTDIVWLVLSDRRSDEERARRRVARSFFTHPSVREHTA
jgi:CRISPR system Cascade subunit CasB